MSTIFTKIVKGEIPSYKVAENDNFFAFLDISPLAEAHTLVIPKKEVDNIFDLPEDDYKELFAFAQKIAKSIQKNFPCKKVGIAVIGLEVPHAHIHLVPINEVNGIDFSRPKLKIDDQRLREIAEIISIDIK
jgi:histidine triad (HIT) family protein